MTSPERPTPALGAVLPLFLIFGVLFGTSQFQRASGGVVMPELSRELGLGAEALGLVAAALFLSGAAAQLPIGLALDRYGARRSLPVLLLLAIAGSALFAAADSVAGLVVARVLIGAGHGGVMMAGLAVFARWFPPARFASASAWMLAIGGFGGLTATAPLAALVAAFGWRGTYFGVAAVIAALAVVTLIVVRDAPPGYRAAAPPPSGLGENLRGLWQVLSEPRFRYILAMGIVAFAPATTILGLWGGPYLRDLHGLDIQARGNVLAAMAVANLVGMLCFGPLDRLFRTRKGVVLGAALVLLAALAGLVLVAAPPLWLTVALLALVALMQPSYVALVAHGRATFPDHLVGRAATTLNLVSVLGIAFVQWIFGLIVGAFPAGADGAAPELAYRLGFAAMAGCVALAALVYTRATDIRPG